MSPSDVDNQTIAKALQDIASNGRRDNERIIKQEAKYEHLTKAMEDLTTSTAASAKATADSMVSLADRTGELTVAIKEIALNTTHLEDRVLREIDQLKEGHADCVKDRKAYNERFEKLELHNAEVGGEGKITERRKHFWVTNWWKFLLLGGMVLPPVNVLADLVNKSVRS